jgi:hypothetical protein
MKAMPHPGRPGVDGATRYPRAALTDGDPATTISCAPFRAPLSLSLEAMLAALSWQANQTVSRQVRVAYAVADFARTQGEAATRSLARDVPAGPLRDAATGAARLYVECANQAADAATRYGRHFGHLAFAFPATPAP